MIELDSALAIWAIIKTTRYTFIFLALISIACALHILFGSKTGSFTV